MITDAISPGESQDVATPSAGTILMPVWFGSVVISVLAGWAIYNFGPFRFELPARLTGLNPMGAKDLLDEAAALTTKNRFWNTLNTFAILGACFGASSLVVGIKSPLKVLLCVLAGTACGSTAAILGSQANHFLEGLESIPGIEEGTRPLLIEVVSYTIASLLLAVPFAMIFRLFGGTEQRQASMGIVSSGILVGCLFPVAMSIALPSISLVDFPTFGWQATLIWLGSLGGLVMVMSVLGSRRRKAK
jgi:hypothetical protein